MSDFVKKKIVEKLARFTKNLKPSDISFKFLTGKGSLNNLELNAQFLTEILQLPPWIQISRVVCDSIKAHVPFMKLGTEPIKFSIGLVVINVSTCTDEGPRKKHTDLLDKIGSNNPSSYGFTEKVIDGMRVEIRSILVHFTDPTFTANLEMTDILIQSTTPDWQPAELPYTRHKIVDEDSVVTFKMCSWSGVKIEGWSTTGTGKASKDILQGAVLRMIANETKIRIAFKRNMSNSSLMHTRIAVHLGDVIWILTQSQLRALSRLVQTLMDAAVKVAQRTRDERERGSEGSTSSLESLASVSGDTPFSHKLSSHSADQRQQQQTKKNRKVSSKKRSKGLSATEQLIKQRISDYRDGRLNIPRHEVIQNSFHLRSGKIDLQLCNDVIKEDGSSKVQGSMLIQLTELVVDVYTDQPAGVGRAQWNMANDLTAKNREWSRKLIERASKTQYMDLPSVNLSELRERGIVVRCANFSVGALRSENEKNGTNKALPIITSDKKTFNIPDDVYNPAFQVSMTLYHYPDKCGTKFLLPRPNMFIYFSPIHINVHQESCLWLVEYVNGVIQTVNLELAMTVKDEGKAFIEEHKAKSVQVPQVPGIDFKVKVLFTKITLPVPEEMSGKGRPKALQVETSAIKAKNRTIATLLNNDHFTKALKGLDQGWVFESQETGQFPHYSNDLRSLPTHLHRLLSHKPRSLKRHRASTLKDSSSPLTSSSSSHGERDKERETRLPCGSATNPEDRGLKTELNRMEGYHIHTSCVQLAFVDSYTHQATLRTTSFVDDFPIHIWVFIPPSLLDKSLANQEPALPSPSTPVGGAHSDRIQDAMISFIAHAPQPIKAKLERLQLLFIMRLKDSFTDFKNSLMRFLVLPSANNKSAASRSQSEKDERRDGERERRLLESGGKIDERMMEIAGNLSRSNDSEHLQILDKLSTVPTDSQQHIRQTHQGHICDMTNTTLDVKSSPRDKASARGSTPTSVLSSGSESDVSATISGCMIVESIEACIILPSILKAHGMSSSGTPSIGAVSPRSPSTPLAGGAAVGSKKLPSVAEAAKRAENAIRAPQSGPGNAIQELENVNQEAKQPLFEGGVANHFSDQTQVAMPHPSQGSQTNLTTNMMTHGSLQSGLSSQTGLSMSAGGSVSPSPQISPAPSQTSLTSQTSQSSQLSLSLSGNMSNTHSPSITSLPTLTESSGDSLSGLTQSVHYPRGTPSSIPSSLNVHPPMRSLSASHLPPSVTRGNATTASPHGRHSTSLVHDRSSTPSPVVHETTHGNNYIAAASQMMDGRSQSERSSPVVHATAMGGMGTENETQSERSSPVVHVTAIGGTGTVIKTQYESKALWSELPHEETDFVMVEHLMTTDKVGMERHTSGRPVEQGVMVEATSLESLPKEPVGSEEPISTSLTASPARKLTKSSSQSTNSLLHPKQLPLSSSRHSSRSSLSSRRMKVQSPPKSEPLYNLIIRVGGICALPNIQAKEISIRTSINDIKLEEVEVADSANSSQRQTPKRQKFEESELTSTEVIPPKVKARIIVGDKVKSLFPDDASDHDIVLIGKANNLDVSLLLPNALIMKDFFDDEYEAENPVPMHLRIENTRVVLMEEASHGEDHVKSMRLAVDRTDIHRGRKLREGVDVFLERGREVMERVVSTETLHDSEEDDEGAVSETELSDELIKEDIQLSQQNQFELTESFNSFLKELEHYLSRDGRQNNREQVVRVLEQIRTKSLEASENDNSKRTGIDTHTGKSGADDAPPSYFDTVSTFFASYHQSKTHSSPPPALSSSPHQAHPSIHEEAMRPRREKVHQPTGTHHEELMRLRRENERLRAQEAEYQKENAQLLDSKENMVKQLADFDMVTEECKSVKEQLVAYKQVMEKQHEQMERLLNENTELQRTVALSASGRL